MSVLDDPSGSLQGLLAKNGSKNPCKELALCAEQHKKWQQFKKRVLVLLRIGLCARSDELATLWSSGLTDTDIAGVDEVTPESLLMWFPDQMFTSSWRRCALDCLSAFLASKDNWCKSQMQSSCVKFARSVFGLFVGDLAPASGEGLQL